MDGDFPSFRESGFYREYLKAQIIFPDLTESQKAELLKMAHGIYERVRKRAAGIDPDLPDVLPPVRK